jgi:predicted nucleic acid-binding protein
MISTIIYLAKNQEVKKQIIAHFEQITYDQNIEIVSFGSMVLRNACSYFKENGGDFEDLLQCFCAEKEECCAIYTNDLKFPKLKVPVKNYGDFDIF